MKWIPRRQESRLSVAVCLGLIGLAFLIGPRSAPSIAAEPHDTVLEEPEIETYDRDHWSWRPREPIPVPAVEDQAWCENPIDHFVLRELESHQLEPAATADRRVLARRLFFDLTGLPPTPRQVEEFVNDRRPDAYPRLVDSLLASDDYGRHAALGWLDLARFAETDGFEHDKTRAHAYRYRDWVISALNDDMPFDEFAKAQIAGDLQQDNPNAALATAFCLSGPDMPDINLETERRAFLLADITATVGAVFLGLQTGCAQCHDHKYDPISHVDYHRLMACFDPAVQVEKNKTVELLTASNGPSEPSRLFIRGDWRRPGPVVQPGVPRITDPWQSKFDEGESPRAAFAQWLTRDDHPLTSRVAVNRIWQHHFGTGLSRTPNDFGVMGDEPRHLDLLDYLAEKFVANGWSRKWLDRLIVTSATYQQASQPQIRHPDYPAERYLTCYPRRRLTGEQIRDAMLLVSGRLSRISGGPSVFPPLPKELLSTIRPDHWHESDDPEHHVRRSIYIFARRNLRYPLFDVFDRPAALATCAKRNESTTATQSLAMWNSRSAIQNAEQIVSSVQRGTSDDASFSDKVHRLTARILGSDINGQFARACLDADRKTSGLAGTSELSEEQRLVDIALALLNSNAFLYVD